MLFLSAKIGFRYCSIHVPDVVIHIEEVSALSETFYQSSVKWRLRKQTGVADNDELLARSGKSHIHFTVYEIWLCVVTLFQVGCGGEEAELKYLFHGQVVEDEIPLTSLETFYGVDAQVFRVEPFCFDGKPQCGNLDAVWNDDSNVLCMQGAPFGCLQPRDGGDTPCCQLCFGRVFDTGANLFFLWRNVEEHLAVRGENMPEAVFAAGIGVRVNVV